MGAAVIYPGGIVHDLPRGRFWGAHNLPGYNLRGGYRLYTRSDICHRGCAYTVLQTVQKPVLCINVCGAVYYIKKP